MMRCAAKYLSATIPIKKGDIMVAIANALYAAPMCTAFEFRNSDIYVPNVTYHEPQIKYSRSIMTDSLTKIVDLMWCSIGEEIYMDRCYR